MGSIYLLFQFVHPFVEFVCLRFYQNYSQFSITIQGLLIIIRTSMRTFYEICVRGFIPSREFKLLLLLPYYKDFFGYGGTNIMAFQFIFCRIPVIILSIALYGFLRLLYDYNFQFISLGNSIIICATLLEVLILTILHILPAS